jgi:hypothetical protein
MGILLLFDLTAAAGVNGRHCRRIRLSMAFQGPTQKAQEFGVRRRPFSSNGSRLVNERHQSPRP